MHERVILTLIYGGPGILFELITVHLQYFLVRTSLFAVFPDVFLSYQIVFPSKQAGLYIQPLSRQRAPQRYI